jgi:hypothetical protein
MNDTVRLCDLAAGAVVETRIWGAGAASDHRTLPGVLKLLSGDVLGELERLNWCLAPI